MEIAIPGWRLTFRSVSAARRPAARWFAGLALYAAGAAVFSGRGSAAGRAGRG